MKKRKKSQSGAELLEAALIAVPLFGLIFLMLDVSMVIFLRSTFQNAVRDGVRYGITGNNSPGPCQDDSIKAVVQANAVGFLTASGPAAHMHVHFMSPVDGSVSNNAQGNIIEVSVEAYQFNLLAPFKHSGNPLIWARAFDVMEPYPGAPPCLTVSE
jgi:Flp pilus assembly protein TadG